MKTYIITDPCYIIPDNDWDKCCEIFDSAAYKKAVQDRNYEIQRKLFDDEVSATLRKFSGDYNAGACSTGFGDWTNDIWGINVLKSDFGADSGMVCVCELTDYIKNQLENGKSINPYLLCAMFETDKDITIEFDTSDSNWTVVKIYDKATGDLLIQSSEPDDESDDEY